MARSERDLSQTLYDCLERIQEGVPLEECLQGYPDVAGDLRPLLQTALALGQSPVGRASPALRQRAQTRFEGAVRLHLAGRRSAGQGWLAARLRPWTTALASFGVFILLGGGTLWASADSLPTQLLYPVKRTAEKVQLALAGSPQAEARMHLAQADRRVQEIARLAEAGSIEEVIQLQEELSRQIQMAQAALGVVPAGLGEVAAVTAAGDDIPGGPVGSLQATDDLPKRESADQRRQVGEEGDASRTVDVRTESPQSALSPEAEDVLEDIRTSGLRNLATLRLLQTRTSAEVRGALENVIAASQRHYIAALQARSQEVDQMIEDVRSHLLQVEARLEKQGNTWVLAGREVVVHQRYSEVHARPKEGDVFVVSGLIQPDGALLALFVNAGTKDLAGDDVVRIAGIIGRRPGTNVATVGGYPLRVAPETEIQGVLQPGDWAQVVGVLTVDNQLKAQRILVSSNGP